MDENIYYSEEDSNDKFYSNVESNEHLLTSIFKYTVFIYGLSQFGQWYPGTTTPGYCARYRSASMGSQLTVILWFSMIG